MPLLRLHVCPGAGKGIKKQKSLLFQAFPWMVALSTLESKNNDKVLNWKRNITFTEDDMPIIESEAIIISEFGDLKVTQIRQYQKRLTETEVAQAIIEYGNGMTTYQLAKKYDCDRQTISTTLKKQGVNVTKCKSRKKIDAEDVIAMYENMHNSAEIAEKYGVGPQAILQCLRSNGIKIRSRWDYSSSLPPIT